MRTEMAVIRTLATTAFVALLPLLAAQTDCNAGAGPLKHDALSNQPDIIAKFAANEALFKEQRTRYTYHEDFVAETLRPVGPPGQTVVDGRYRQIMDVSYDQHGNRVERVSFAPQSTMRRITMTRDDFDDVHIYAAFVLTPDVVPHYNFHYEGRQQVDELDTYVFEVAPVETLKGKRYFQGRIWVDVSDIAIVKTCGKTVPDIIIPSNKKKGMETIHPTFVTYRQAVDGKYWFPAYTRSDDDLVFRNNPVMLREVVKFTDYHPTPPNVPAYR